MFFKCWFAEAVFRRRRSTDQRRVKVKLVHCDEMWKGK
jgi:hypothetical protein